MTTSKAGPSTGRGTTVIAPMTMSIQPTSREKTRARRVAIPNRMKVEFRTQAVRNAMSSRESGAVPSST